MTRMKRLIFFLCILATVFSCRERKAVERDTIPYVKQLAVDTAGTFTLVKAYRDAGSRGSIAIIGEPEASLELASDFLSVDAVDNIDGKAAPDRLPDFSGEVFDVVLDLYNSPYLKMAASSPDSLREVAVRNAVMAIDTVAYSEALDPDSRLRKTRAKVFVLATSLLEGYGRFDIDTLFKMAGREALILTPVDAMLSTAVRKGCRQVAVWAPEQAAAAYDSVAKVMSPELKVSVISTSTGIDIRTAFRDFLRQFRTRNPHAVLDAVLLDSFLADREELEAELDHIHRQITEEDMAFDRILAPEFHFIEPRSSLTSACYRLLRERNLFTHNIAYPSARYYQTEENQEGLYVLVEVGFDYLSSRQSLSVHVPNNH